MATTARIQEFDSVSLGQREEASQQHRRRPEHQFIHTVRFWSMVAIVFLHSAERFDHYQSVSLTQLALLIQPFKFGTIAFFIISGFLVGDRLPSSNPLSYLRRRVNRLLPAWVVWYGVEIFYSCQKDLRRLGGPVNLHVILSMIRTNSVLAFITTPLWFVPNFLVALTCVVVLRRWLNDLRLGAALLALSLFYGVNVYTEWVPSLHTEAFFGFVFYIWLGAWCALRKDSVVSWAQSLSGWWLALGACIATLVSLSETAILQVLHRRDPLNSLRISTQIYAILVVLLLVRIRRRTWPAFVNVAETTYGVYLIHFFVINLVYAAVAKVIYVHGRTLGPLSILLMWILLAPIAYLLTLQVTRMIASSARWGWVVGATRAAPRYAATNSVVLIRGSNA